MRKILKCLTAMLLTVIMILPTATAFGVRYGDVTAVPGGFWALLEAYTSAIGAGDSERITAAG
ncbi:MAG: hypothetical protein FWB98_05245, partial [Defluviitaleaceae bacterium]|nr:hypothetical protein [Defluviitaleaceae bacterium]